MAERVGAPVRRKYGAGGRWQRALVAGAVFPLAAALSFTLMALILVLVVLYVRRFGTEELL